MALLEDRNIVDTEIGFFMDEVAERGGIAVLSTSASGVGLDNASSLVTYSSSPSGKVAVGMLIEDMVNYDLTRQTANFHKDEVQKGNKVCLVTRGWVVTNKIVGTPTAGAPAYIGGSGNLTATLHATGGLVASPLVGKFLTTLDENGYARVSINL